MNLCLNLKSGQPGSSRILAIKDGNAIEPEALSKIEFGPKFSDIDPARGIIAISLQQATAAFQSKQQVVVHFLALENTEAAQEGMDFRVFDLHNHKVINLIFLLCCYAFTGLKMQKIIFN